jgi:transposase
MTTEELYGQLLGIRAPWGVAKVKLDETRKTVEVYLEHAKGVRWKCPKCGQPHGTYDHTPERRWRHLDSCEYATYLYARLPRVECEGQYREIPAPWAAEGGRITLAMECRCIDTLRECDVTGAHRLTGLDWSSLWQVVERAVKRGRARKRVRLPPKLGVDEKSFGRFHRYETIVCDLEEGSVEYIAEGRKKKSLDGYFAQFSQEELAKLKVIALDMWPPYIQAVEEAVPKPQEKIVFDRFHAMRYVTDAVDRTRRQEQKLLQQEGNDALKGSRYLWLWNAEDVPEERRQEFAELKKDHLRVGRAWSIKESFRDLWKQVSAGEAKDFFQQWYFWATHSRLPSMIAAAKTLKAHLAGVLNSVTKRITNACAEGLNSKIEMVKRMACGFRNREHYRTMVYFHCGKLDLYPTASVS